MRKCLLAALAAGACGFASAATLDDVAKLTVPRERRSADGKVFRYRWAEPARTEAGRTYPLLVLLHGAGERGTNNVSQLLWGARELLGFMKRKGIDGYFVAGQVPSGMKWVDTPWSDTSHRMSPTPSETMAQLFDLLDEVARTHPVDRSRIYVTGLSMGGYGTWDAIQRRPDFFAAALPCCGGGDSHLAWKIRDVPIWTWHGDQDTSVPVCRSRDMVAALWAVDGNIRYTEIPGCGHGVWGAAYASDEALKWLFSQRLGTVREPAFDTLIAHRGESAEAPENTLHAYRMAVSRGFGFECDVYLSADKRVFSFHDGNLARTTGGACTKKCAEASWETEISKVDVGGWGKWKDSKFSPTRPALLEEILELAADGRQIYIEIKTGPEIIPYVKEIFARQTKATPKNVCFITFGQNTCAALKREMPAYKAFWLVDAYHFIQSQKDKSWVKGLPWTSGEIIAVLRRLKADGVDIQFHPDVVTADFARTIRKAGFELHVWTINSLDRSLQAFACGAQSVTTDCPKRLLDEYASRKPAPKAE